LKLVTFLITTYNAEEWIKECIHSVCKQSYSDLQILIIDDGSFDSTTKIISKINDPRIDLYIKPHSGISKSLNFAIDKIRGEYVARMGADDYCDSNRIMYQMKFKTENPEYGIVGSNYYLIDGKNNLISKMRNPTKDKWIKNIMTLKCSVWDGSALFDSNIFRIGFNEKLLAGEDWDFFLRVLDKTKFYNLRNFLTYKRIHDNNISNSHVASLESKRILINFNESLILTSHDKNKVAQSYFNIGYLYYYESNFAASVNYFKKALENNRKPIRFYRYYFFAKYFSGVVKFIRKRKLYRYFAFLKFLDRKNRFFRPE